MSVNILLFFVQCINERRLTNNVIRCEISIKQNGINWAGGRKWIGKDILGTEDIRRIYKIM